MTQFNDEGAKREPAPIKRVSPKTYAQMNELSTMSVYRLLRAGKLRGAVKLGSQWRIPIDA